MKPARVWGPALVFLICFAAYVVTLNPAFRADDSPETIAASVTLGIQHPPAYPLHTLVGRIFSFVPVGAPAFRLNLMAAFFGALTCGLLAATVEGWLGAAVFARLAGVLAGLMLGLSKTFWSQSLAAKGGIYTLHSACMAGLLLCLVLWSRERSNEPLRSRWALLALFVFAVSFGNHWETQALLAPATLAYVYMALRGDGAWNFWRQGLPRGLDRQRALLAAGFVVLGLSVYAYLPLRAQLSPFMNWGDPRDWTQFWWVFLRQEYLDLEVGFLKSLRAALLGAGTWQEVGTNWAFVQRQGLRVLGHLFGPRADLGFAPVLVAGVGAYGLWQAGWSNVGNAWERSLARPLAAWLTVLVAAFAFVVTFYFHLKPEMIWILDVFLIPAYLVEALLVGLGVQWLFQRWKPVPLLARSLWALPVLLALVAFLERREDLSQARHFIAWDYGQDLLLSAKKNAVVLAEGDFNTMPVYYLQQVAGKRPDIDHLTTVFLSTDWGVDHARRVQPRLGIGAVPKAVTGARAGDGQVLRAALGQVAIQAQASGRPIQASWFRQVQADSIKEWEPGFRPNGLLAELNGGLSPADDRRRLGLLKALRTRHLEFDRDRLDPSPEFALSNYGTAVLELANYLRLRGDFKDALPLYDRAATIGSHSNLAEIYTHHGIALATGGPGGKPAPDLQGAADYFRRSIAVKPIFEAYANLAGTCNQIGQATHQASAYVEAEKAAREAVVLGPSSGAAWNNLAIALYYQNRAPEAVEILRKASQLAPGDPQILANLKALGG